MEPNFAEFYRTVTNRKQLEQEALEYLVTDTLQKRLSGPTKSKQLTAMDMESYAPADFVPSMFYTFMYNSPTNERVNNIQFKDRVPLIFCTSYENGYITGLNFNLIPCNARAVIIDRLILTNPTFYETEIIDAISNHKFAVNTILANSVINPTQRNALLFILDTYTGLKISNCFRIYKEDFVINPRLIEYDMWKYIPFLTFRDAVRGVPLAKLQQDLVNDSNTNK